jgi:hypothetical protein
VTVEMCVLDLRSVPARIVGGAEIAFFVGSFTTAASGFRGKEVRDALAHFGDRGWADLVGSAKPTVISTAMTCLSLSWDVGVVVAAADQSVAALAKSGRHVLGVPLRPVGIGAANLRFMDAVGGGGAQQGIKQNCRGVGGHVFTCPGRGS